MAIVRPIQDREEFEAWVASRPVVIQEMIAAKPPDRLYRLDSGHRATIYSYSEDRTVTVEVTGEYNRVLFGRNVFGIPIDELQECELPEPDEDVGDNCADAGMTEDDIRTLVIPRLREDMLKERN